MTVLESRGRGGCRRRHDRGKRMTALESRERAGAVGDGRVVDTIVESGDTTLS